MDDGRSGRLEEERQPGAVKAPPWWLGHLIAPAFLAAAAWFAFGPSGFEVPAPEPRLIAAELLDTAPRREALGDPPTIKIDGFERTCMDCHRLFPPRHDPPAMLLQHKHVVLHHGINDRCRNCHHPENRDKLVLHDGTIVNFADAVELCAKCHGPTHGDWVRGAHGRTNGYWDTTRGEMRRLKCTECHDPHNPRFPAMDSLQPLPGPRTLRMGSHHDAIEAVDGDSGGGHKSRNPLERHVKSGGAG